MLAKPILSDLTADAQANELVRQTICDKFNVNLEIAGQQFPNDQDELLRTMISGGEQVDIINSVNWMQCVEDGSIILLNDLSKSNGQDILNTALYGACIWMRWNGMEVEYDKQMRRSLQRDGFWPCFTYLPAWNEFKIA